MLATKQTKHHTMLNSPSMLQVLTIASSFISLLLPKLLPLRLPLLARRTQKPIQHLPPLLGHINHRLIQGINNKPIRYNPITHISIQQPRG